MYQKSIVTILFCLIALVQVFSQPFSLDKNLKPVLLNLIPYTDKDTAYNGKINITDVKQVVDTSYYYVKGLSIYQPVIFTIVGTDGKNNIQIRLSKDNWKKPDHVGSLGANNSWQKLFRTEGSFGIQVIAPSKNAAYKIMVWVGNEPKKILMPSPFKEEKKVATKPASNQSSKKSTNIKKKKQ